MTTTRSTLGITRVAAVVAGLGLVAASFAPMAMAQTTTTTTTTTTSATFTRDLTLGSTGADVTALQNWLISKGHSIAAGATGYFGAQTRAALAAWQAANGVMPAAGYFGPMTRARVAAGQASSGGSGGSGSTSAAERLAVMVEIRNGRASVEATTGSKTERFTLRTTSRSAIVRDVAQRLGKTEDAVRAVIRYREVTEPSQQSSGTSVRTNAAVSNVDGVDNDFATFEVRAELQAFGEDIFVPTNGADAFTYRIEDASTGATISGATTVSATVSSSADTEGSSYRIGEGDKEEFIFTVNFNPLAGDEGKSVRLQFLTVAFGDTPGSTSETLTLRPESRYETPSVFISD